MTSTTEKLANNYVWKSEYDKKYSENFKKIFWNHENDSEKWEEVKTESGKVTYRLKGQNNAEKIK